MEWAGTGSNRDEHFCFSDVRNGSHLLKFYTAPEHLANTLGLRICKPEKKGPSYRASQHWSSCFYFCRVFVSMSLLRQETNLFWFIFIIIIIWPVLFVWPPGYIITEIQHSATRLQSWSVYLQAFPLFTWYNQTNWYSPGHVDRYLGKKKKVLSQALFPLSSCVTAFLSLFIHLVWTSC